MDQQTLQSTVYVIGTVLIAALIRAGRADKDDEPTDNPKDQAEPPRRDKVPRS